MTTYRHDKAIPLAALHALRADCEFDEVSDAFLSAAVEGARWVCSAWDGERLVGFVRVISDGVALGYVSMMMVASDRRRAGIGRELLRRVTEGKDTVRFVLHSRPRAKAFYEDFGFEPAEDMYRLERKRRE